MILGRLAIDRRAHGRGLGKALLRDAILRTLKVSEIAGVRALLVHALDEAAAGFYRSQGFVPSPTSPLDLLLDLRTARRSIATDETG